MAKHCGHWHEYLTCTVCKKVFFGECSFDRHLECGKRKVQGVYRIENNTYILKNEHAYYLTIQERAKKARARNDS